MKILMLTPYLPYPLHSGGQIRTYNFLKQLSSKHQVTLFALIKDDDEKKYIPILKQFCQEVQVFKRSKKPFTWRNIFKTAGSSYPFLVIRNYVGEVKSAVAAELKKNQYDLIHAETFYMMPHLPATKVPVLLVEQTIEYLGYESYAAKAPWLLRPILNIDIQKIKYWETHYWQTCTKLVVMSNEDKSYIAKSMSDPTKIAVVENGVDTEWFAEKQRHEPLQPTLLSVGTFKWLPNVEAVRFLVDQIWPAIKAEINQAQLWIVGASPTDEIRNLANRDDHITVTGDIPDIRDAFAGSHVLIAPVFSGKGTRYKILEALAAGTPVVATATAVEGLGVKHNQQVMVSNQAEEMAAYAIKLINSPADRKRLAKNGRKFVQQNFDWMLISKKLDSIYRSIGQK